MICEDGPAVVQVPALPVLVGEADRLLARRGINLGHGAVSIESDPDLRLRPGDENCRPGTGEPATSVWTGGTNAAPFHPCLARGSSQMVSQ